MMKIEMTHLDNDHYYIYIVSDKDDELLIGIYTDKDMAECLDMTREKYRKILLSFGGYLDYDFLDDEPDTYFYHEEQCKKAFNYLNEKYGVMLALRG